MINTNLSVPLQKQNSRTMERPSDYCHLLAILLLSLAVIILSCQVISMKQQLQELLRLLQ